MAAGHPDFPEHAMPSSTTAHLASIPVPTDDLRISRLQTLSPPAQVIGEAPATSSVAEVVGDARHAVHEILHGRDDRLVVVIGPCSIHDPKAALDYARRLAVERERHAGELEVMMRVYFEKPRTTVGWKGLINDPDLDGGFRINKGLRLARNVLLRRQRLGPAGGDRVPRRDHPAIHRRPGGLGRDRRAHHREPDPPRDGLGPVVPGRLQERHRRQRAVAADAVKSAAQPHHFMAVTKEGRAAIATTTGNEDCHVVLRGGKTPNYDAASVAAASEALDPPACRRAIMVDASHANSGKNHENQPAVIADLCAQVATGRSPVMGVMIESNLVAGRQDIVPGQPLTYGQSVTDACIDWETSVRMLDELAAAVRAGRAAKA
jgi:3-deoxy-7-phosphoheptulonate synthase